MPRRRSPNAKRRRRARHALTLSDEWRVWVVDNLLAQVTPAEIIAALIDSRVPEAIARAEVTAILQSPSLVACQELHRRNRRLELLARLQRALSAQATDAMSSTARAEAWRIHPVERRDHIPTDEFLRHYFAGNRPVVWTGYARSWPAFGKWSPEYFKDRLGAVEVEIVSGRGADPDGDRNFDKYRQKTTMSDYVDRVLQAGESNDIYMIAHNKNMRRPDLAPLIDDVIFDAELFDREHLDGGLTLWFGPAGTVTPLHHDNTNILFCQIYGRKKVFLVSPWETALLASARGFYSEFNLEDADAVDQLEDADIAVQGVELQAGDALFIPAGWWHHIKALDISITFSLLNFHRPNDYSWYRPGSLD